MINLDNFKKITITERLGASTDEDLQNRLELGICEWDYIITTDEAAEPKGSVRHAIGTRNLSMSFIDFNDIPMGIITPPAHVLTYFDVERDQWRCCNRATISNVKNYVYIEE